MPVRVPVGYRGFTDDQMRHIWLRKVEKVVVEIEKTTTVVISRISSSAYLFLDLDRSNSWHSMRSLLRRFTSE